MRPIISVVVPVYNAAATLERCVGSILCQLPRNGQIVLVNDGSTDDSANLCVALAKADERITVIHQQNAGASAARSAGLDAATGRYIQFVDSDDWLKNGLYDAVLPLFNMDETENPNAPTGIDMVVFGVDTLSRPSSETLPAGRLESLAELADDMAYYLVDTGLLASPINKIYTRALIGNTRFDRALKINEDLQFNMQVLCRCGPVYFEKSLYYVCDDSNVASLSRQFHTDLLDIEQYTRPAVLQFLNSCGLHGQKADELLATRLRQMAVAQCSTLLSRRGRAGFGLSRQLFCRALGPTHCRAAVLDWVNSNYTGAARLVYAACTRLRLCSLLALLCSAA